VSPNILCKLKRSTSSTLYKIDKEMRKGWHFDCYWKSIDFHSGYNTHSFSKSDISYYHQGCGLNL